MADPKTSAVTTDETPRYPMRVVTRLTGLSADTVRVWERRYDAVSPARTSGGARRYSDADIQRLMQLKQVVKRGHTISAVANLSDVALTHLLDEAPRSAAGARDVGLETLVTDYLDAVSAFEARRAEALLNHAAVYMDPVELVAEVLAPILRETGRRWAHQRLGEANEHLVSSQVRSLLGVVVRHLALPEGADRVLLTTPGGHRHEFGALLGAFYVAAAGLEPLYLGPDLPEREIARAVDQVRPRVLVLSAVRETDLAATTDLALLIERLSERCPVWVGTPADHPLAGVLTPREAHVRLFHDFESFSLALRA